MKYIEIKDYQVPDDARFDVPRANAGQILEVAYGGFGAGPWDDGDRYKRVLDRSTNITTHHRRESDLVRCVRCGGESWPGADSHWRGRRVTSGTPPWSSIACDGKQEEITQ